jgi:hypothetical protein
MTYTINNCIRLAIHSSHQTIKRTNIRHRQTTCFQTTNSFRDNNSFSLRRLTDEYYDTVIELTLKHTSDWKWDLIQKQ